MTNPEVKEFSIVWLQVCALAIITAVLLLQGHHARAVVIGSIAFGMFAAGEQTATTTAPGTAGTMTNFMYLKIGQNWLRILIGAAFSMLIYLTIDHTLGIVFLAWLPWHYAGVGPGPVDWLIHGFFSLFGLNIRTW